MKIKISLLLGMLACLSAFLAAPALAANVYEVKTEQEKTQVKNYVLVIEELELKCEKVTLTWVQATGPHSTLKVNPTYEGCKFEKKGGGVKVASTVNLGACEYEWGTPNGPEGGSQFKINTTLVPSKCAIIAKSQEFLRNCTLKFRGENNKELEQIKFVNTATGGQLKIATTGIAWTSGETGCISLGIAGGETAGTNGKETGSAEEEGIKVVRSLTEITVNPTQVEFGNTTSAKGTVEYTNKGTQPWHVPALVYTVIEGQKEAVKIKNGCEGKVLGNKEKCSIELTYEVPKQESYKAEMKLGSESPTVPVKAEAPKVAVDPTNLKLGNARKVTGTVTYTNEGPGSWSVPEIEYTVLEGKAKTVEIENGCKEKVLNDGEECHVTLTRQIAERERYKAELKFGNEAPTIFVEAEGPLVKVKPTQVKFGNAMTGDEIFKYTNKGDEEWEVPALKIVTSKGSKSNLKVINGCEERILLINEECSIEIAYNVIKPENYLAELELGIAPIVLVEAEA
jgi:hypothetical protein